MTILDKVIESFKDCEIGTVYSRQEAISKVVSKFGCNESSIIPSDYCYNRINNGIDFDNYLHIFEYTHDKKYKYLGVDYPYNGKIYHKPKGEIELPVGEWVNGQINRSYKEYENENIEIKPRNDNHKTKRDISIKLRFDVLKRDNFKCCYCGASPAKDPSIILHVDHIIPWAKGGETIMDNLQTSCSTCNLGKRDSILK